jgi:hypothetical protein
LIDVNRDVQRYAICVLKFCFGHLRTILSTVGSNELQASHTAVLHLFYESVGKFLP